MLVDVGLSAAGVAREVKWGPSVEGHIAWRRLLRMTTVSRSEATTDELRQRRLERFGEKKRAWSRATAATAAAEIQGEIGEGDPGEKRPVEEPPEMLKKSLRKVCCDIETLP